MDYDYHIKGKAQGIGNANASASIYRKEQRTDIYLHPYKCIYCDEFFNDIEDQMYNAINHEVQESLVVKILMDDNGEYKNEWFDKTCGKQFSTIFSHDCGGKTSTIHNSGYFR